jgi:hypothetical protein
MIESEFRDWARGQLRAMDDKLERIAKERAEPRKYRPSKAIQDGIQGLAEKLIAQVKEGNVAGLAIAYVDGGDMTYTGWALDGGYFALAGATTFLGLEILEDHRKAEIAAANENGKAKA